jgi:hypothetical protein
MLCTSSADSRGVPQNEHGWRPSSEQMILPQLRQFGAGAKSGCIEAKQLHFRDSLLRVGFVETSNAAMAAVRSEMLVVVRAFLDWDVVLLVLLCLDEEGFAALDFTFGR